MTQTNLTNPASPLTESDAAFNWLVSCVQDYAIYMLDPFGMISSWNVGAERIYGYAANEIVGQSFISLFSSKDQAEGVPERELEQARLSGRFECREVWRCRQDNSLFLAEVVTSPVWDAAGNLQGYANVTRDVSMRQRMEDRFRRVVEYSPGAIVMVNERGIIEMVNTQTERLFGYTREEMLSQPMEMLLPIRFRRQHPTLRATFFASPSPRPMGAGRELFGLHCNGSEFPIEIGLNPIETDDGMMVLSVIVDISERKRLEQRFRQVVQEAPSAMIMVNQQGKIILFNRLAETTFGYQEQEMLGQLMEVLIPDRFRQAHPQLRTSFLLRPEARPMGAGRELFGLRKDGVEFPIEIGLNPIETEEGTMVLAAIVDITSRKSAQLLQDAALKEKTMLLNEIHHRVKNNLQVIISLLNMQANYVTDDNIKNVLIDSQARVRSMALIHQLLYERHDFSRVDLGEYLQRFGQLLLTSFSSPSRQIALAIEAEENQIYIELQRATPCGLLINELVTNAFKYAYPAGTGTVSIRLCADSANTALLVIADKGVGLPKDGQAAHSKALGLQLVPILADQIGASLSIHDNQPGVRFEIRLPMLQEVNSL